MSGLELFKAPGTTAVEIADIVSNPCPPVVPEVCDKFSCRECWQAWLETGKPPKEKGPSDKQTTPDEEGLHPNLVEMYAKAHRRIRRTSMEMLRAYGNCSPDTTQHPSGQ